MDVGKVTYKITGDNDGFNDDVKKSKSIATNAAKSIGTAFAAATVALAAAGAKLVTSSVKAFAENQQLVGGIETLYKDASASLIANANKAYKTAGLSANAYMETATSFAARLIQGLGGDTEEAARLADVAITDMADNVNKLGSSVESVQAAYQGFAKQNYTMLDNLKLGYGGTAGEMARLINDSGVLGDTIKVTAETVNDVSFDKIVEAIHVVQEGLGVAGATAEEAESTITGSLSAMVASFGNLKVGIASASADLPALIQNVADTAAIFVENITPIVENAVNSLPTVVEALLPAANKIIVGLFEADFIPRLIKMAGNAASALVSGIAKNLPQLIKGILALVPELVTAIISIIPDLLIAVAEIVTAIAEELPALIITLVDVLTNPENINAIIGGVMALVMAIVNSIPTITNELVKALPTIIEMIISGLLSNLPQLLLGVLELIAALIMGLISSLPELIGMLSGLIEGIVMGFVNGITELIDIFKENGGEIISNIWQGIVDGWENFKLRVKEKFEGLREIASHVWEKFKTIGSDIITNIWEGIKSGWNWLTDKIKGFAQDILNTAKSWLGISSPSKAFETEFGEEISHGAAKGIEKGADAPLSAVRKMADDLLGSLPSLQVEQSISRSFGVTAAQPVFNINLTAAMEVDGLKFGELALRNMDDAASMLVRG